MPSATLLRHRTDIAPREEAIVRPVLTFDPENLLAASIGPEHGLTESELARLMREGAAHVRSTRQSWQSGEVGFLGLPDGGPELARILEFAGRMRGTFETLLLVGIGGSSLGAEALDFALRPHGRKQRVPELRVLDNPDPSNLLRQMAGLVPAQTQTVVISKSGGTLETLAALALVDQWYQSNGCDRRRHISAITGANNGPLARYASRHSLNTFTVPENVGGRFSVLSSVGLLPAAMVGHDVAGVLAGAKQERDASLSAGGSTNNGPLMAAAAHAWMSQRRGKSVAVMMPYHSRLHWFGAWFVQLWAESLGKAQRTSGRIDPTGQTAVSIVGPQAQHSQLQLFLDGPNDKVLTLFGVRDFETELPLPDGFDYELMGLGFLRGRDYAEIMRAQVAGTREALTQRKRPNALITVDRLDAKELGALFMFHMLQTVYAAAYLEVNPYDQPAVEIGKRITRERLGG